MASNRFEEALCTALAQCINAGEAGLEAESVEEMLNALETAYSMAGVALMLATMEGYGKVGYPKFDLESLREELVRPQ
jgi:hypothetical protein